MRKDRATRQLVEGLPVPEFRLKLENECQADPSGTRQEQVVSSKAPPLDDAWFAFHTNCVGVLLEAPRGNSSSTGFRRSTACFAEGSCEA